MHFQQENLSSIAYTDTIGVFPHYRGLVAVGHVDSSCSCALIVNLTCSCSRRHDSGCTAVESPHNTVDGKAAYLSTTSHDRHALAQQRHEELAHGLAGVVQVAAAHGTRAA